MPAGGYPLAVLRINCGIGGGVGPGWRGEQEQVQVQGRQLGPQSLQNWRFDL